MVSKMRNMNFMPSMGLGKNQDGSPEFVERKMPILKHGVGYRGNNDFGEEDEIGF